MADLTIYIGATMTKDIYDPYYERKEDKTLVLNQWSVSGDTYSPAGETTKEMPAGLYVMESNPNNGAYFKKVGINTTELLKFPDTNADVIFNDIQKFWDMKDKYVKLKQAYKRGFLLYGDQGCGKSSVINLVIKDLIEKNGIAIRFDNPYMFSGLMHKFRQIEPNRNIVVLMEDIDSIIDEYDESSVLNILDGVSSIENVVYIATTNYPEKLLGRITNRPSRFDRVFKFTTPDKETRKIYLENLIRNSGKTEKEIDIDKWIKDTGDLTIAHIKELFISVCIFDYSYEDVLHTLKDMKKEKSSDEDKRGKGLGF